MALSVISICSLCSCLWHLILLLDTWHIRCLSRSPYTGNTTPTLIRLLRLTLTASIANLIVLSLVDFIFKPTCTFSFEDIALLKTDKPCAIASALNYLTGSSFRCSAMLFLVQKVKIAKFGNSTITENLTSWLTYFKCITIIPYTVLSYLASKTVLVHSEAYLCQIESVYVLWGPQDVLLDILLPLLCSFVYLKRLHSLITPKYYLFSRATSAVEVANIGVEGPVSKLHQPTPHDTVSDSSHMLYTDPDLQSIQYRLRIGVYTSISLFILTVSSYLVVLANVFVPDFSTRASGLPVLLFTIENVLLSTSIFFSLRRTPARTI